VSATYPPQPWDLVGRGWITTWALDRAALPELPAGVRPVGRRGRAVAATMFVDYGASGLLAYGELLAGVLVRRGARVGLAITDIWVDSPASREGGRALWGVPKELADFGDLSTEPVDGELVASTAGADLARASFTPARLPGVPLPLPVTAFIAQTVPVGPSDAPGAETVWTPVRAGARSVRLARGRWSSPATSPLGWMTGARPLVSVVADGFEMRFGA